jgi:hypothetical protein
MTVETETEDRIRFQFDRKSAIEALIERDGFVCQYPGCTAAFNPNPDDRYGLSLDHIYPQVRATRDGWTYEEIWDLGNLQLMHRVCNARKSDLIYDENGELPQRGRPRSVKVARPDPCGYCDNGRALYPGQYCDICFSGPQPAAWPATMQRKPKECDHEVYHCWLCVVGHVTRIPASADVFGQED